MSARAVLGVSLGMGWGRLGIRRKGLSGDGRLDDDVGAVVLALLVDIQGEVFLARLLGRGEDRRNAVVGEQDVAGARDRQDGSVGGGGGEFLGHGRKGRVKRGGHGWRLNGSGARRRCRALPSCRGSGRPQGPSVGFSKRCVSRVSRASCQRPLASAAGGRG